MSSTHLHAARRSRDLADLHHDVVDVLVVGGGVTGAGVALDAAARGLSVALIDKSDLAAGTSRWSSKLAHGGLRYIVAGQVGVAWESAVERNHLVRTIAPHLIRPMHFVIPDLPGYPRGNKAMARAGFSIAEVLRVAARTPSVLPRTRWVDPDQARKLVPALQPDVRGAFVTVDGSLEDDARLVVAIARTAAGLGARVITHCRAEQVSRDGARVRDELTGQSCDLRARVVVVAAGVWCGGLVDDVPLQPSKGAHVLVRAAALGHPTSAFNILIPGSRNRFVFAVPRPDGTVQVGLTDDAVDRVEDEPQVSDDEEDFLLSTLSTGLGSDVTSADVVGRFAGLRPLLGQAGGTSAADLSRRHALLDRDGVLVVVGGKLTTYRRMAQDAVDLVVRRLGVDRACSTTTIPLVGANGPGTAFAPDRLSRRFGAEAADVAACGPTESIAEGLPMLQAEACWAVAAEGAVTAADVERRLRLDLVPEWAAAARPYLEELVSSP
ncbi:MAG TPA: glycerol-3-phosphate dehydrogenase/oxidase [Mycobacteriales bacterium]|nr:glycerol-3-phosphate dehydrogenase/oxidase [Mycobacteriales bacterium]